MHNNIGGGGGGVVGVGVGVGVSRVRLCPPLSAAIVRSYEQDIDGLRYAFTVPLLHPFLSNSESVRAESGRIPWTRF